jgi:predicted RNA-binding protein with PUA domain
MSKNYSTVFDNIQLKFCEAIVSYDKEEEKFIPNFSKECVEIVFSKGQQKQTKVITKKSAENLFKQLKEVLNYD